MEVTGSAIGSKIYAITARIRNFKSIVQKKINKHDKIVFLEKSKLIGIGALISKALIRSVISYDDFISINYVLKEYDETKKEIKNLKTLAVHQRFQYLYKTMLSYYLKSWKNTESKNPKVVRAKNGRIMFLSKCAVYDSKKSTFIKEQEASGF